jgi:hypothetical protein
MAAAIASKPKAGPKRRPGASSAKRQKSFGAARLGQVRWVWW